VTASLIEKMSASCTLGGGVIAGVIGGAIGGGPSCITE
jgi:hypothetical protein